ncbi:hypothetical protein K8R78_05065 [bacterium]|nr:hypothetical protein [bacterium]
MRHSHSHRELIIRYLIVLLVVLSAVASFGSYELESARIVDAGRFGVTAGGVMHAIWLYTGYVAARLGVEYGLFDNFSLGFKGDYSSGESDSLLNLNLNLKTNIAFFDLPIYLGFSLGGELNNRVVDIHDIYHNDTYFSLRGNLTLQAWFVYLGFTFNTVLDDASSGPISANLGLDIEFNDYLSLLGEVGVSFTRPYADVGPGGHYHWPYYSLGVEFIF